MAEEFTWSITDYSLEGAFFHTKLLVQLLIKVSEKLFTDCSGIRVKVPAMLQLQLAVAWEAGILPCYGTGKMCER